MASAAATPCRTCSVSSHPSPAPSSPTPSTSSEQSRKRKRDEAIAEPKPFLITPPNSEDGASVVPRPRSMPTIPMFTSIWQSLKSWVGLGSTTPQSPSPPGGDEGSISPKRARLDGPSESDDVTPKDDPNKEPIASTAQPIQLQSANKESPPPQTHNNRPSLNIKAPVTTDKRTPPNQLPSPLASSPGDELEILFKKTARPVHPLPSTMADPLAPAFFTRPLRKRSNPEAVLQRVLARRAAFGKSYPPSAEARGKYPPTQIPRRFTRKVPGLDGEFKREGGMHYPLLRRLPPGVPPNALRHFKTIPKSPKKTPIVRNDGAKRYSGRVAKYMNAVYANNRKLTQMGHLELAVILEQLNREKYTGFQTLEQVEQRRKERNIEIAKLRAAIRQETIPPLDEKSLAVFNRIAAELVDPAVPANKEYNALDGFLANKNALYRVLWKTGSTAGNWLNDETMNFYVAMIARRANIEGQPMRILYFNNIFWTNLLRGANVSRWAKRQKAGGKLMLDLDYLIFPCNHGDVHWSMCVVNFKQKRIENYDSMYSKSVADRVFKTVREYLIAETGTELNEWTNYNHWNTIQQLNAADCGMFSLKSAEVATRGAKCDISQSDMPLLRQRMIVELVTGTLFPPQFAS